MNILLLGGTGRTGSRILAELSACAAGAALNVRAPTRLELDLAHMSTPESWRPWLKDVDVVIHAAGVLREDSPGVLATHLDATRALCFAAFTGKVGHLILLSSSGADERIDAPWFAAHGAADAFAGVLELPTTVVRAGALYVEGAGRVRRFHPHALTLDWHGATGGLPVTRLDEAVKALVGAVLRPPPAGHKVLDLAEPPLAHAA